MTGFVAVIVILFVAYIAIMMYFDQKKTRTVSVEPAERADTDEPKSLVQSVVQSVREKVMPHKPSSARMEVIGTNVSFIYGASGSTYHGVVIDSNRHATRLAIATRINGAPCVVKRRAKSISMFA